jgi:hypothetical protein
MNTFKKSKSTTMKHLKQIQILTPEAIFLLERVKMYLETYVNMIPTDRAKDIFTEFTEFIEEVKAS